MNLFELFVKIGVDDQASGKLSKLSSSLGKGLATAAKIGTAAVTAAAAGITALTKSAVENYAEYEQLVGGVETLFKDSADVVKNYASEAYKSAGLSANEYMSTVTSFSASLLQSLGRGAQTDLDALKENLDEQYDATKKSWQDRIAIAKKLKQNNVAELEAQMDAELKALKKGNEQKLAEAETANNKSVITAETQALAADLANQAVIDMADNAAKMGTSMEMIQNAYAGFAKQNYTMLDNLKLGYGGTQSEMQRLIKDAAALDSSIDANSMSFANIVKAINVVQTKMGITGTTAKEAGRTIEGSVNAMKSAWTNLVTGFADKNADIEGLINNLVTTIVGDGTENNLGVIGNVLPAVETALVGIGTMIEKAVPVLVETLPGLLQQILPVLLSSATSLVNSVIEVLPELVDLIVDTLIDNAPMLIVAAVELILALAGGLIKAVPKLLKAIPTIIGETVSGFKNSENIKKFIDVGKNIIDGIKSGIKNAWNDLVSWFKGLFDDLIGIAKKILGIASPSKVFKKIGGFTAEGFGAGFEDEFAHVKDDMENALDFDDASIGINASIRKVGAGAAGGAFGGTSIGNVNITVNGAKYTDEQSLASAIALEIQNMTDRRAAVYA